MPETAKKCRSPGVGLIDSQSVKTTRVGEKNRGVDGGKKVKGRKRHIITDIGGLLLTAEIYAASKNDGRAEFRIIKSLSGRFERMKKICTDGDYRGELADSVKNIFGWDMEITLQSDRSAGFKPLPRWWVVEKTFYWLENFCRLDKDYLYKISTSLAIIHLAFIALMLNRIYSQCNLNSF
jgi:putative transposase